MYNAGALMLQTYSQSAEKIRKFRYNGFIRAAFVFGRRVCLLLSQVIIQLYSSHIVVSIADVSRPEGGLLSYYLGVG